METEAIEDFLWPVEVRVISLILNFNDTANVSFHGIKCPVYF